MSDRYPERLQSLLMGATILFGRTVPNRIRQQMRRTRRHEVYCQMCGVSIGDLDAREAVFRADMVPNNSLGIPSGMPELRILCLTCNQGAKNITGEKPTAIWLLSQVRRAGMQEQKAVFEWLSKKFGK